MDNAKLGNEIYKTIYSNYEYVHITEQMENVHDKQIALHEELNKNITQIRSLDVEYADLYNKRIMLKGILKSQIKARFAKNSKTDN